MSLMTLAGQSFRYVLVIYPSLDDQAGGERHREHGWQAGGYMNSSFFFFFLFFFFSLGERKPN